jgi:hypothetical protein
MLALRAAKAVFLRSASILSKKTEFLTMNHKTQSHELQKLLRDLCVLRGEKTKEFWNNSKK